MGFASAPATRSALAPYGIRESGVRWKWAPGAQGLAFPPHQSQNGQFRTDEGDFDALPGEDVNGDKCLCWIAPLYRTADGRIAKAPVSPVFLPPGDRIAVTAALTQPQPIDFAPLIEALSVERAPQEYMLNVPEGAFTINLPELNPTFHVAAPSVNVEAAKAPDVTVTPTFAVEPVTVTMDSPTVNVAAPNVTVEPQITVKPAPVKIIREKVARAVRFRRNTNGQITEAEVTSE